MSLSRKLFTKKLRFLTRLVVLQVALLFLLRLTFFCVNFKDWVNRSWGEFFWGQYLGFKFDLRLSCIILAPCLILSLLPFLNMTKNRFAKVFWKGYFLIFGLGIVSFYLMDLAYYAYLKVRMDSSVLRFLETPDVSLRMVWQTYPIIWGGLGLLLFSFLYLKLINKFVYSIFDETTSFYGRFELEKGRPYIFGIIFFFLWAVGIYGKVAWYPLRWSEAFFSKSQFISNMTLNPVLYFLETVKYQKNDYDLAAVEKYYEVVSDFLGVDQNVFKKNNLKFLRKGIPGSFSPEKFGEKRPNIVIVVLESFAAYKSGHFGNPFEATPYFDKWAEKSLFFKEFYVPSQATARSIFGLITGIPDVGRGKTSSRNPLIVEQHSVLNSLIDYEKYYFLGGSANWGNIRGIFSHNIEGIHIVEEGQYSSPRVDVWGISDYHLMDEAFKKIRQGKEKSATDKPFFALIQSSGYHRPYTIPKGQGKFKVDNEANEEDLQKHGFISRAEYNSIRFQDYAFGHFMELLKSSEFYEDTIVMVLGDHGIPVNGASHIIPGVRHHDLENFHVPFIIHYPKAVKEGKTIENLVSEVDIMPTVAHLAGYEYINNTLGRDMLESRSKEKNGIFTFSWYMSPPTYGFLQDNYYFVGNTEGRAELYDYKDNQIYASDQKDKYPKKFEKMRDLANGHYEVSRFLLYHNRHLGEEDKKDLETNKEAVL